MVNRSNTYLPFSFTIGAPARHTVNNTTIGTAISTLLAINTANTPARKAPRHAKHRYAHTPKCDVRCWFLLIFRGFGVEFGYG
ncbi:MAG: hypothetical protein ACYSWZ_00650 [Planctomycetota bacterium]